MVFSKSELSQRKYREFANAANESQENSQNSPICAIRVPNRPICRDFEKTIRRSPLALARDLPCKSGKRSVEWMMTFA